MSRSLILDTNAYSDFARLVKWVEVISTAKNVYLPLIVIGELKAGFLGGSRFYENEAVFDEFLSQGNVMPLIPDTQTTHYYSVIFRDLKRRGIHIPQNDLWIAALALQHGLWLCTSDSHFDHIPQLLRALP